jgi:hypothetical protein
LERQILSNLKDTSKLHASIEDITLLSGYDCHCWFEADNGEIYNNVPGDFAGDIEKYNKDNPNTHYNLRSEYPQELQNQCYEAFIVPILQKLKMKESEDPSLRQRLTKKMKDPSTVWDNKCLNRAAELLFLGKWSKRALRFGGIGWKNDKGVDHYEFG